MKEKKANPAETLKPPLKWSGGKRWLVPRLQPIWEKHQHRRFVEPLCGRASWASCSAGPHAPTCAAE